MENVSKHRDIKLVTTESRKNYVVSEPNYHTTKLFTESLLATEMRKTLRISLSMRKMRINLSIFGTFNIRIK